MNRKYNIGLDIGTTSVGWAVVEADTQKIIRKGKRKDRKALWGVRLFEEASTAEGRRGFRSIRRRYDRRRNRIKLLQQEFKEEINKVDNQFFKKLEESKYCEDDKVNKSIILSADERKQVKEYNDKYKTIYHLRNRLITDSSKEDIRLVYLSLHHIIKYRGNFLYNGDSFNVNNLDLNEKLKNVFEAFINYVPSLEISENYFDIISLEELEKVLLSPSKNDIKVGIKEILNPIIDNKNFSVEFGNLVVGNKFNIKKLFLLEDLEKDIKISFDGTDYDDKYNELEDALGDNIEVLNILKELYDTLFLKKLFKGSSNTSLSSLMVERYNIHKSDLRFLKDLFDKERKLYNQLFRTSKEDCLYEKYIHNKVSYEDFSKELKKLVEKVFDSEVDSLLSEKWIKDVQPRLDNGEFLPRITDPENGKYPYQLNKDELIKIIENQGQYYPFLKEKVDGKYKIVKLLEFRIPYYVGPLVSENKSQFAWMERNVDNVAITPYNFDEVVDKEATAEKFIKRMISHCTYLLNEYALPNNSILYSRYKVMNELKQIKINGEKIRNDLQHKIIDELFIKTTGSITDKKFKEYLYSLNELDMYEGDINVTGYSADGKFANNMQSFVDFFGVNGIFNNTSYNEEDADEIIEWITIFDDKDILEKKVRNKYTELNDNQVKSILSKKYSGWGSLSKKLLTGLLSKDKKTGISKSIMTLLSETEENFMQIINNDEYKFQDLIKENNTINDCKKINYDLVRDLATSPATKKGIYQSLKVVEELVDYIGYDPENIMIEMAREENTKKGRKDDKKKYLLNLYEKYKNIIDDYNALTKELKSYEKIDSQKLFLYFIQEGKCLYTGKPLNIEDLDSYEVDHIIPRTLIKDDSIDNKALVYRECNQVKAANFVLPSEYRTSFMKKWWTHLKSIGLISAKKFYRLTRDSYKDEDIQGFINRQLVETRQITKHVANIINNFYKNTKVVYLKADLSHNYRERYELYKFREINDYHHAHDAYLAAVLGEYKEKYMKKNINFEMVKEMNSKLESLGNYKQLKYGFVINSLDENVNDIVADISKNLIDDETGELLFDAREFNKKVEDTLYRNDILVSRKTEIRSGEFYNQTKQKKGGKGVPLKSNMPIEKYGSYTSLNPSCAIMIKYENKGQKCQRLVGMPIYINKLSEEEKRNYYRKILNLKESAFIEITCKALPFYSLLNWNGQICYLVGASDKVEVCNAKQFSYSKEFYKLYKHELNHLFNYRNKEYGDVHYSDSLSEIIIYIVDKMEKEYKLFNNLIDDLKLIVRYKENQNLTIDEKENIVIQLTKLLNCRSDNANFKFLDSSYSSAFGKKNDRIIEDTCVIHLSVTGVKKSNYELQNSSNY